MEQKDQNYNIKNPKFFFQLPQPSIFSTHVSLRQPTTRAFGKTFYPHSSCSNHCKGLYACSAMLPADQADVSVIFHTSLTLGPYFLSPSTLRFSRDLNYPTSLKSLLSLVIIPP